MGEVGTTYKDFTAIGPVVNLTSRLQGFTVFFQSEFVPAEELGISI
jgi:class 3 adenylate cyclase